MIKRSRWIALTLLLLLPCISWAEVKIRMACRIKNRPPGRCGWCALETLARHHQLTVLYGLTDRNDSRCCPSSLEESLTDSGVTYRIQYPGTYNQAILKYAIREKLGAVVGFRELYSGAGGHIVTLVDLTEDSVKVIDSNDEDRRTRTMTLDRFLYWWDGFALVLEAKVGDQRVADAPKTAEPQPPGAGPGKGSRAAP
jgi:hypothetical protein